MENVVARGATRCPRFISSGFSKYDPSSPIMKKSPKEDAPQWAWDEYQQIVESRKVMQEKGIRA
ncbi:MAG: hypothetical protein FWG64_09165 [Firmicutes bacterium]|nr:hypothetical protein [Bacillota bacterium]